MTMWEFLHDASLAQWLGLFVLASIVTDGAKRFLIAVAADAKQRSQK